MKTADFQKGRAYQSALDHIRQAETYRMWGEKPFMWKMEMDIARNFIDIYRMWATPID